MKEHGLAPEFAHIQPYVPGKPQKRTERLASAENGLFLCLRGHAFQAVEYPGLCLRCGIAGKPDAESGKKVAHHGRTVPVAVHAAPAVISPQHTVAYGGHGMRGERLRHGEHIAGRHKNAYRFGHGRNIAHGREHRACAIHGQHRARVDKRKKGSAVFQRNAFLHYGAQRGLLPCLPEEFVHKSHT